MAAPCTADVPAAQLEPCALFSLARLGQSLTTVEQVTSELERRLQLNLLPESTIVERADLHTAIAPQVAEDMAIFRRAYAAVVTT